MDGWTGRLCALLVVLTLGACGGGPTPDQTHQGVAAASKTFTYQLQPLVETDAKVTYAATLADGQPLPGWLTFDSRTRTFVGIPPDGDVGVMPESLPVQVVATGATGVLAKTAFTLRIMQAPGDVPQIVNPAEELVEFDPKGLLRWSAVPGADAYEVWVFRDAALKEAHEFSGALTSRQYQFTKLAGATNYYVKLYFRVNGAWADAPTVPIATTMVVVKPRLTNSQEELEGIHTGGTLRWTTVAGAGVYELWVFRDPSLEAFAETSGQLRVPQYQLRTLEAGRTYYAQVYSQINGRFHVGAPLAIRVVADSNRARIVNPQEELDAFATNGQLRWSAVTGATSYEAWIFTNPSSSESYESSGPLTARSYTTRTLQPGSTYYAQVYALVNGEWQVGSSVKLVTTPTATIARFTNPQEELEGFATGGTLRWTEVPGATLYDVWIYGNAGLGVVAESGTGTNRAYQVEKLCKDATYYAQVYALVNGVWTTGWATRIDVTQGTSSDKCAAPVPDIRLSASATEVTAGQTVTLTWTTKFAASCTASDGWSGASPVAGQTSVGPIQKTTLFTLTCSGSGGASRAQVLIATVAVVPNVIGLTTGAADLAITSAGFVVGTVTTASSDAVPAGRVISQSPDAGQLVVSGGKVNYVVSAGSAALEAMLRYLPYYIDWALVTNRNLLPANPSLASYIQAKITMLQNPNLVAEINNGQYWSEGSTASRIRVVALFPMGSMRVDATQSVETLERALPVLENFMATPLPANAIWLWYGFIMGNSGGGGMLNMEDQDTYETRTPANRLPYDAILCHELAHSFIGHESLTQFLELYLYNMLRTNSQDLQVWVFTRNYVAWDASNTGIYALLDVYQLIGPSAMARAYRKVYPLHPPYGQPLSAESKQAFIDQAPSALKVQVANKMAMVTY